MLKLTKNIDIILFCHEKSVILHCYSIVVLKL